MATVLAPNSAKKSGESWLVSAAAEASRYHLDAYGAWVHDHKPARHHRIWVDRITELVEGRTAKRKLLVISPPGHAKSTWLSLIFPPWYLGNHPDHSLLFYTSADVAAGQFSGTVKSTMEGGNERHALTFPADACQPDRSRGWSSDGLYLKGTPAGSKDPAYRALGYGAAVIGARCHGAILDDPLTQEQAQSEVETAKAKRYFDMTVDSRLHPDGWTLAIMTRWSDFDLAAHLAAKSDWEVLEMPALGAYPWGGALWPERFSQQWLEAKRADIGGPVFNCLYQGDPTSMGGTVFREAAWFRPLPADFATFRPRLSVVQFWDLNYSESASSDYTACLTIAIDPLTQRLFVPHAWRGHLGEALREETMADQIIAGGARIIGVEEAAYRQRATQDLVARLNTILTAKGYSGVVVAVRVTKDKVFRARLPAGRAEAGMVYVDLGAPWAQPFIAECLAFPLGANDDYVDALSGGVQLAIERGGPPAMTSQDVVVRGGSEIPEHDPRYPSQFIAQNLATVAAGLD